MRSIPVLVAGLLAVALLAGCSQAPQEPAGEAGADDGPGRTARGAPRDDGEEGPEVETVQVEIFRTPFTAAGPADEAFDVVVPANVTDVLIGFVGSTEFDVTGLKVSLSGCGSFDQGLGVTGTTNGDYWVRVCGDAQEGAARLEVSARLMVVDGTLMLVGVVPVEDKAASPGNGTTMG